MYLWILVAAQFLLAAAIVLSADWRNVDGWIVLAAGPGIALAVWAWVTVGFRRLRVHPSPDERTRLVKHGPYRIVRHPMYAGLIWFSAVLLPFDWHWWRAMAWVVLTLVLVAKSRVEERALSQRFDDYAEYRRNVGGLMPKACWQRSLKRKDTRHR
jgi:protein-S-isoprenylcysteine O-methyltransferase Ste14